MVLGVLNQVHSSLRVFFSKRRQRINKLLFCLSCAFRTSSDNLLELLVDMVLRLIQFLLKFNIVDKILFLKLIIQLLKLEYLEKLAQ